MLSYVRRKCVLTQCYIFLSVNEDSATYLTGLLRSKAVAMQCLSIQGLSGVMIVLLIANTKASRTSDQIQISAACKRHKERPFHLDKTPLRGL